MAREEADFEIQFFERLIADNPGFVSAMGPLAELYTKRGLHEKALELDLCLSQLKPDDPIVHYNLACSWALVGKKEESLKTLERAIQLGYDDFEHMKQDDDFASLRDDPRFQALLLTQREG